MKLSISNIAWLPEEDINIYRLMQQYSFTGLEIAPTRLIAESPYSATKDDLSKVKQSISSENLSIVSMQSLIYNRPDLVLFGNKTKREELKQYIKSAIDFASILGIPNLVFGSPKNRVTKNITKEYNIAVDFFKELGDYAADKHTVIAIEANPMVYGTNFINTTKDAVALVNAVQSKGFKLQVDIGTIIINNESLETVEKHLELINHIHISEPYLNLISKEHRNIHIDLYNILIQNNYQHWVSIEMKKHETNNVIIIEKCLDYVSKIFGEQ